MGPGRAIKWLVLQIMVVPLLSRSIREPFCLLITGVVAVIECNTRNTTVMRGSRLVSSYKPGL